MAVDISQAAIYVGTYSKYNAGSLAGAWLNLADYADIDEFYAACRRLHSDENDPEFMFQNRKHIPDSLCGECWLSPKFFELRDELADLSDTENEAFFAWLSDRCTSIGDGSDVADLISQFRDAYCGEYDSEEEYAEQFAAECEMPIPDWLRPHIDWESYARDLFMTDFSYTDGYVFRIC